MQILVYNAESKDLQSNSTFWLNSKLLNQTAFAKIKKY